MWPRIDPGPAAPVGSSSLAATKEVDLYKSGMCVSPSDTYIFNLTDYLEPQWVAQAYCWQHMHRVSPEQ